MKLEQKAKEYKMARKTKMSKTHVVEVIVKAKWTTKKEK